MVTESVTRQQRSLVYAVGADPLLVRAIAAELSHASVSRFRGLTTPLPASTAHPPDLVVIGPDVSRPDLEREAVRHWWGGRPLVVEAVPGRPLALVWLGTETVRLVEMAPGFLLPFLVMQAAEPLVPSRWRPVHGWQRIAHAAASLMIMAALTSAAVSAWTRATASPPFSAGSATAAVSIDDPPAPSTAEPGCPDVEPC